MERRRFSLASAQVPVNTRIFYGWFIVVLGGLGIFFSGPGQTYSVSVFIDSYIGEFGWSRSYVSSLYSLGTLCAGFALPFIGRQVDKRGHRVMTTVIALAFGSACFWMSLVSNPLMLFIGFMLIRMMGQGSMSLVSVTLVPQWFQTKRGRALSLMSLGGAISSALLPPLNTYIIQNFGWQIGWRVWALMLWLVFLPLAYLFIRNTPEQVGTVPDGTKVDLDIGVEPKKLVESAEDTWTLAEAMRSRAFWLLLFCTTIPSAVNTGMIFHQVSIMRTAGLSVQTAAFVLSLMALVQLPISLIAGQIVDRVKIHYVIAASFAAQLVVMVVLLKTSSIQTAVLYGCLRGVVGGFEAIYPGVVWPNYFGRKHLGSIRGMAMTASVMGSAFGPLPFGFAFDRFGGYQEILLFSMLFPILGLIAALLSPKPSRQILEPLKGNAVNVG